MKTSDLVKWGEIDPIPEWWNSYRERQEWHEATDLSCIAPVVQATVGCVMTWEVYPGLGFDPCAVARWRQLIILIVLGTNQQIFVIQKDVAFFKTTKPDSSKRFITVNLKDHSITCNGYHIRRFGMLLRICVIILRGILEARLLSSPFWIYS